MRKQLILIALATLFLTLVLWKGLQYFQGNDMTKIGSPERKQVEKHYNNLNDALKAADSIYEDQLSSGTIDNALYKLKNKHYIIAHQMTGQRRNTTYVLNSYIEMNEQGRSALKLAEHFPVSIKKGKDFRLKEWRDNTAFGKVYYQSGVIGNNDDFADVVLSDAKNEHGYIITPEINEDVIKVDRNGHWLDSSNFTVGYKYKMKSYISEQSAVDSALQHVNEPGKLFNVIRTDKAAYYIFKHRYGVLTEWLVLPVLFTETGFDAGRYHRYTFIDEDIVNSKFTDEINGVKYSIIFEREAEQPKNYKHIVKDGKMKIAIIEE